MPPLEVNIGDILGVYQPQVNLSKLVLYNQKWSGPANYAGDGNAPHVIMAEGRGDGYDHPLVAVEVKGIIVIIIEYNTLNCIIMRRASVFNYATVCMCRRHIR